MSTVKGKACCYENYKQTGPITDPLRTLLLISFRSENHLIVKLNIISQQELNNPRNNRIQWSKSPLSQCYAIWLNDLLYTSGDKLVFSTF